MAGYGPIHAGAVAFEGGGAAASRYAGPADGDRCDPCGMESPDRRPVGAAREPAGGGVVLMVVAPNLRRRFGGGDLNGVLGLVVDNLSLLAFMASALVGLFGMPADLVF